MKLDIINLLPESSHKHIIDNGSTTHRISDVIGSWYLSQPSVGLHHVTDGNYLYCRDYWNPEKPAVLLGEDVNGKKTIYDHSEHFKFDNKNSSIEHRHHALIGISMAKASIIEGLNYSMYTSNCVRFELCRTRHRKTSNCSGIQIRFHKTNRRIIKTHDLYDVYKYEKIPFLNPDDYEPIFSALQKEPQIMKPNYSRTS